MNGLVGTNLVVHAGRSTRPQVYGPLTPVGIVFESRHTIRSVPPSNTPPLMKRVAKVVDSGSRWS